MLTVNWRKRNKIEHCMHSGVNERRNCQVNLNLPNSTLANRMRIEIRIYCQWNVSFYVWFYAQNFFGIQDFLENLKGKGTVSWLFNFYYFYIKHKTDQIFSAIGGDQWKTQRKHSIRLKDQSGWLFKTKKSNRIWTSKI